MQRHDLDPVALVFGVVFVLVAGGYLLAQTASVHLHWVLIWPATLIVVGLAALAVVIRRVQRERAAAADADPVDVGSLE